MNIIDRYYITEDNTKVGDEVIVIGFSSKYSEKAYNESDIHIGQVLKVLTVSDEACIFCSRYKKCYHELHIRCINPLKQYIGYADAASCEVFFRKVSKDG